ncbi:MAG: T9SS type A sorting domain-containing protein, partial [Bacteroidota bacterium]
LTNDGRINGARIQLNSTSSGDGIYNCTGVFITGSFFEEGTSTVIMSGAEEGAMLVTAPSNLYDLVIDKATPSTKVTFTDDFINLNDLSIKNGIFENDDFMRPKNIFIEAGGTLNLSSALFISGDVENNGQINPIGNARLLFNGDTTSEIRGSNPFTLDILEIDKSDPNAELQVSTDVTVNTKVEFDGANQGNINIESGTIITLASGAFIENETEGGYIFGDGSIETTVDLNAPSAANPGNLGVEVTSAASLGSTNIERFHQPQMSNGIESIARFYIITPTTNTGLDATVRFYYLDEELGFANESDLNAYRLLINNVWDVYPAIAKNTDLNFVEIANLDAFSTWTLFPSDLMVLPVNLLYFDAKAVDEAVVLKWETASELNNAGFEVARSTNTKDWKTLGFVKGAGTTVTAQSYQYIDDAPAKGINYYRLKQIDTDGTYEYSEIIAVNKTGIGKDALVIAPNPVDDVLHYQLLGQKQATQSLQIYDASGQLVKIITDQDTSLPIHDLAKGMYILVVEIGNERLGAAFMKQ